MTVTEPTKLAVNSRITGLISGTVWYVESFRSSTDSDSLCKRLLACIDWQQQEIQIYGRQRVQPSPIRMAR